MGVVHSFQVNFFSKIQVFERQEFLLEKKKKKKNYNSLIFIDILIKEKVFESS